MAISTQSKVWKKIEKFFGIVGFIAAIAAIIGVYYQFQSKKNEVQFVILSKDYLTVQNNIEGLESNYRYIGQPVKNLWLLKFKIINTGDQTLIGTNKSSDLLDSVITFKFNKNVQILNNVKLIKHNFPDHNLKRFGLNELALSFQQWRPNESGIYSIYVQSNIKKPNLLPTTNRSIKDGNIIIDDLTTNQRYIKQPLIDQILGDSASLVGRILGIILGIILFLAISIYFFGVMLPQWIKLRFWLWKYSKDFKNFINNFDEDKIMLNNSKKIFSTLKNEYLKDPTNLTISDVWKEWKKKGFAEIPEITSTPTTWKSFIVSTLVISILYMCTISIVIGLWIY